MKVLFDSFERLVGAVRMGDCSQELSPLPLGDRILEKSSERQYL